MQLLALLLLIAAGMIVVERLWPARALPRVDGWWARIALVNVVQLGIVLLAGVSWDRWLGGASLFRLRDNLGEWGQALVAYFISTFVYYWWHRWRHTSRFWWRVCHQLHHSPRRIELLVSFYKHPVEITINSVISALIVYGLCGCTVAAAGIYTALIAVAEYFYHWNIRTPHWLGFLLQRPESHRIHHQYRRHTGNFADLPLWDALFGTLRNAPAGAEVRCGYDEWREDRFEDMLGFRDVHAPHVEQTPPLRLLPTCLGCGKRWTCAATAATTAAAATPDQR